jgi:hypothetical protein
MRQHQKECSKRMYVEMDGVMGSYHFFLPFSPIKLPTLSQQGNNERLTDPIAEDTGVQ